MLTVVGLSRSSFRVEQDRRVLRLRQFSYAFSSGRRYYDSVVSLLQGWLVSVHRNRRLIRDGSPAGTATSTFTQLLSSACCRVAVVCRFSDIRDKMRPMPKHGSIQLYVHGNPKAGQDGQPRTATSTLSHWHSSWPLPAAGHGPATYVGQLGGSRRSAILSVTHWHDVLGTQVLLVRCARRWYLKEELYRTRLHRVPGEIKRSRDLRGGRWSWTLTFAQKRS